MVREEDEGLHETKAGSQVVLQSKVLLLHRRPACRVLTHTNTHTNTQDDEEEANCEVSKYNKEHIEIQTANSTES